MCLCSKINKIYANYGSNNSKLKLYSKETSVISPGMVKVKPVKTIKYKSNN
jgi:hypothetical protein